MNSAGKGQDPPAKTESEGPFQVQNEGLPLPSVINTPKLLRRCTIADINLHTPSAYRKQLMVVPKTFLPCAVLPSLISFNLARPRCANKCEY